VIGIALALAAAMETAPTPTEIAKLQEGRILESLASPTRSPGRSIVEFAPTIETRNVVCDAQVSSAEYVCRFESRTKAFTARTFGPWEQRSERVTRDSRGHWRFEPTKGSQR